MRNLSSKRVLNYHVRIRSRPRRIYEHRLNKTSQRGGGRTMRIPKAAITLRHQQRLPCMSIFYHAMWIVSTSVWFCFVLTQGAGTPLRNNSTLAIKRLPYHQLSSPSVSHLNSLSPSQCVTALERVCNKIV